MTSTNLPEPLTCPDSWKYSGKWQDQYENSHGNDYLSKMCKHSSAGFRIMYYICYYGEVALTKIKTQNLFIKRITAGTVNSTTIRDKDIDWQSGATWLRLHENWEELFEIYNAKKAPADILEILDEVKTFMNKGQLHCQSLFQYIADARADLEQKEEMEREQELLQQSQQPSKWDLIDEQHSKVVEGFIYLLSNDLMPGIYKIGFTAGNPDKRARELSVQYGLPMPFEVIEFWQTKYPYIIEQRIHTALASYSKAGEFFELDLDDAIETIEAHLQH